MSRIHNFQPQLRYASLQDLWYYKTLMIWILVIAIIVIVSFILALRSMKNYQEIPTSKFPYGLFLILNESQVIESGVLNKLHDFCSESNSIISLERLFKGTEKALVIYAPKNIAQFVPELQLLEIEDYLEKDSKGDPKKSSVDQSVVWSIEPKNESSLTVSAQFLKGGLPLEEQEHFFWQLVMSAHKNPGYFQLNIRAMIVEKDIQKRVELTKRMVEYLKNEASLEKKKDPQLSIAVSFENFKKRSFIPNEVEGFVLSTQKIKELI